MRQEVDVADAHLNGCTARTQHLIAHRVKFQARHALFQEELPKSRLIGHVLKPESLEAPVDIGEVDFVAFLHLFRNGEMVAKYIEQEHLQARRHGPHTEDSEVVLLFGLGRYIRGHVKRALRYRHSTDTVRHVQEVAFGLVINGEEALVLLLENIATRWDWTLAIQGRVLKRAMPTFGPFDHLLRETRLPEKFTLFFSRISAFPGVFLV